jgi:hypothetical protein
LPGSRIKSKTTQLAAVADLISGSTQPDCKECRKNGRDELLIMERCLACEAVVSKATDDAH